MTRNLLLLTVLAVLLCFSVNAYCSTDAPIDVTVDGEAYGSDLESAREAFERAKADAQRKAIEQAVGTFVRSHTIVSNSQLAEDLVYARVRGRIERLEVLSQTRDKNDPNHFMVKVRATISPVLPDAEEGIQIKIALTKSDISEGDDILMQYQANVDCFLYIFVIGADNSVTQLLPNSAVRQNAIKAGQAQLFPPEGSGIRLTALLEPGVKSVTTEKVKIIGTKKEEPLLQVGFQEGFKVYNARSTGLASELLQRLNQLDPSDWGEATATYRIVPKP